jgi:hypothetical protein
MDLERAISPISPSQRMASERRAAGAVGGNACHDQPDSLSNH